MNVPKQPSHLKLGNEGGAFRLVLLSLLITAGILAAQMVLRTDSPEPRQLPIFWRLFLFEDYSASLLILLATLLVILFPRLRRCAAVLSAAIGRHPFLTSASAFLLLCFGAVFAYQAYPLSMDESSPYMQARIFSAGHLTGSFPPELLDWLLHDSVREYFIHASRESGQVASTYWPGFALLLTPFMALGIPWACNPLLGALALWVVHRLALEIGRSEEAAGVAVLLTVGSAAFVINSISFYSMTAHLLCNAAFALLVLRPGAGRAALAGFIGGLALNLHNPVPHALFALPWLLWLLWSKRWRDVSWLCTGYLPWVMAGFAWRFFIDGLVGGRGEVDQTFLTAGMDKAISLIGDVLSAPSIVQLQERGIALGKLWLWAAPMLVLLAFAGFRRHRHNTAVQLLMASAVVTFVGYLYIPVSGGHGWGYRYFHSVWFVLPVLASMLVVAPSNTGSGAHGGYARADERVAWGQGGALAGLLFLVPYFAWQTHAFIDNHLRQLPVSISGEPRLLLVNPGGYYSLDLVQNDPFLRDPIIRMASRGEEMDARMVERHFPDLELLAMPPTGQVWGKSAKAGPPGDRTVDE